MAAIFCNGLLVDQARRRRKRSKETINCLTDMARRIWKAAKIKMISLQRARLREEEKISFHVIYTGAHSSTYIYAHAHDYFDVKQLASQLNNYAIKREPCHAVMNTLHVSKTSFKIEIKYQFETSKDLDRLFRSHMITFAMKSSVKDVFECKNKSFKIEHWTSENLHTKKKRRDERATPWPEINSRKKQFVKW